MRYFLPLNTALRITELEQTNAQLSAQVVALKHQVEWFKRQLFGQKSEKQLAIDPAVQGNLLTALGVIQPPAPPVAALQNISYQRRKKVRDAAVNDTGLRFGADVTRDVVTIVDPAIAAVPENRRVLISERIAYRLAQRPGSYGIIEFRHQTWKLIEEQRIVSTPAPATVLERCVADVSLLSGMLVDKFCYHLPLYRQHQRIAQCGIQLSRTSLTNWTGRSIDLLRPIAAAQHAHILTGSVVAMDETPIKAGREKQGKMRQAYLWPIYGE
jgi:transposase